MQAEHKQMRDSVFEHSLHRGRSHHLTGMTDVLLLSKLSDRMDGNGKKIRVIETKMKNK
jgi:hypothetical protein